MAFETISTEDFLNQYIEKFPGGNKEELRKRIQVMLRAHEEGEKCACGNDLWVIGSAFTGKTCFLCLTGERTPNNDYEIDTAIKKTQNTKGHKHIDEMDPAEIHGFFDDEGYEVNTDMIRKPGLCLSCEKNDKPGEEFLCNMNRYDQRDDKEFKCFAYQKKKL